MITPTNSRNKKLEERSNECVSSVMASSVGSSATTFPGLKPGPSSGQHGCSIHGFTGLIRSSQLSPSL